MNVHRATCSCSVELYKQWFTLADFFAKLGYFAGFSLHIISVADAVKIIEAASCGVHFIFRVPRCSFGVRRSSVVFSVAQKDAE
jgi:hypothetical protein